MRIFSEANQRNIVKSNSNMPNKIIALLTKDIKKYKRTYILTYNQKINFKQIQSV